MSKPWPLVLLYHGVIPRMSQYNPVELGVVFQDEFDRHLAALKKNFRILHPDEFVEHLANGLPFSRKAVLVTIDDGCQNTLDYALPVAEACDVPILAFIASGHMDQGEWLWYSRLKAYQIAHPGIPSLDQHSLEKLSISEIEAILDQADLPRRSNGSEFEHLMFDGLSGAQLAQAARSRYLTIGGHTVRHPRLVNETPEVSRREIFDNKKALEAISGQSVQLFAYPQGIFNEAVMEDVRRAGYLAAFAADEKIRPVPEGWQNYCIPRTGVYKPGKFWFWYVSSPAGHLAKSIKSGLSG